MELDQTIEEAAKKNLQLYEIKALVGRDLTAQEKNEIHRIKAMHKLALAEHRNMIAPLSQAEVQNRYRDRLCDITKKLEDERAKIDWKRRQEAESDIVKWVQTYCVGLLLETPPPPRGEEVLRQMAKAVVSHSNYMILMGRGSGKTTYIECVTLYALATGIQKFVAIVSASGSCAASIMNDIWKVIIEPGTAFAQDYPDINYPFAATNGSFRKRQLFNGMSTELKKTADSVYLPRLYENGGDETPSSGSIIVIKGLTSSLRGMKKGKMRPTLVLLDDLQDSESASNPKSVQKTLDLIRKDIMNLGGRERLSILQTATPICPEDLVEQIQNDKAWKTSIFPAIISWPKNSALWKEYFKMFDAENVIESEHANSLQFYRMHREEMDEGSEVFNPSRFSEADGHISALQKLLEQRHMIGAHAFLAEYQMQPAKESFVVQLDAKTVHSRIGQHAKLSIPDGVVLVAAATDLNVSYGATITLTAFKPDMTSFLLYKKIWRCSIDGKLNDVEYTQQVYKLLCDIGRHLKELNIRIDAWAIDCGGRQWDAACSFAKNSAHLCGIKACGFAGKASHMFNPYMRSRLADSVGRTVLCGNSAEHVKAGAGWKYVFFDSDFYRYTVQKALLTEPGSIGSCTLFNDKSEDYSEFCIQVTNERLVQLTTSGDGRQHYTWKSVEPHDYLDCMAMSYAVAAQQNLGLKFNMRPRAKVQKRKIVVV